MDLQRLIDSAVDAAERGDNEHSAKAYQAALDALLINQAGLDASDQDRAVRSIAFNLAQVLNKLRRYSEAVERVQIGMARNPTALGRAIGLAAKGEALCGLEQTKEGMAAFEEAVDADPITGRLNSAESMLRLGAPDLASLAGQWVDKVVVAFGDRLDTSQRKEVAIFQRQVADAKKRRDSTTDDDTAESLVAQAKKLARTPGKLHEAANLLERALEKSPRLHDKYEYQLQLWRKGITMRIPMKADTDSDNCRTPVPEQIGQ